MVGHAPGPAFEPHSPELQRAQWRASDLLAALPDDFEVHVCEERRRTVTREGQTMEIDDATLLARRPASNWPGRARRRGRRSSVTGSTVTFSRICRAGLLRFGGFPITAGTRLALRGSPTSTAIPLRG